MQFKGSHLILAILGLALVAVQWVLAENASGDFALSAKVLAALGTVATVIKTVTGILSPSANVSTNAKASLVKAAGAALGVATLTGCLSSAPLVPETAANQAQIQSCQNTATLHDGVVIGDFVLSGTTAGLAGAAAAVSDANTKTTLGVVGASVGGVAVIGAALAELTASNFQNSQCSNVVGPLPTAKNPASK